MDGGRERRQEIRRLTGRFLVAVSFYLFAGVCNRAAGLTTSDPNPKTETTTKNGHVAFYWASLFNKMAHFAFLMVISQIILTPISMMVVERMRKLRVDLEFKLKLGLILVIISFFFLAYFRWFVVASSGNCN